MQQLLVAGAGNIGSAIAHLLASIGEYEILLCDLHPYQGPPLQSDRIHTVAIDLLDRQQLLNFVNRYPVKAIICCLPYFHTVAMAELAKETNAHYFDLTEDVDAMNKITELAEDASIAFVPQCGLAPGFIDIVAHDLMQRFNSVETVKLRCGALPQTSSNGLQYALTWSVEGVINEYGNPCLALVHGELTHVEPLADLEMIQIDGEHYEAFNTSGGIGSLAETYRGTNANINYKTIRYPGHCDKMRFLMQDLQLNEKRDVLKNILVDAIPHTREDVVLVYVSVHGKQNNQLFRETYVKKFYPISLGGMKWTAIQATTASTACAVIDIVLTSPVPYRGRIKQETFTLAQILENRFGQWMGDGESH